MKWIRNRGKLLFLTALFTLMLSQTVLAEQSGKITAESVKIRSSADASSTVVGSTERGKTVSVIGKTTDANGTVWYQVYVDENATGYIRGDLLELSGTGTVPDVQSSSQSAGNESASVTASSGTGTVTPPSTNIRNAAVTGDVICTLQSGMVVTITGETTGSDSKKWYQVSFIKDSKEYTGYIRADLVDTSNTTQAAEQAQTVGDTQTDGENQQTGTDGEAPAPQETQAVNADAALKSLTLSSGAITPEFSSDITSYTIQVEETITEIAISAVVANPEAQILSAEGFSELQPGLNTASIVVEAPDKTTQTYNFSIICGEVGMTPGETEEPEEDSIEIEGAMEDNFEDGDSDMVDIEEYNKYKELAEKRLIIMCVLGFLVALMFVIILNLLLKIHDMKEEAEEDEEEERPIRKSTSGKTSSKRNLFEKHEYVKLDEGEKPLKQTLTEKEQKKRTEQRAQKSVLMPDLKEEKKARESYESDHAYEDEGLDDDFEFEFINLDSKR